MNRLVSIIALCAALFAGACGAGNETCAPDCTGRCGGDDGCGGTCPAACPNGTYCESASLACLEACSADADCVSLGANHTCDLGSGECTCAAQCAGRCAGDDGCGDTCPDTCTAGLICHSGNEVCWDGSCTSDADCPSADMCINGVCGKP